ncbi:MAG: methylenetetrahydrofolate reductase [NAD(P)H] [Pseudomonadota bacterium]
MIANTALISDRIKVSFEFFPPKTREHEGALWHTIERLSTLAPDFVSVTYGAGGSTRDRTLATVRRIAQRTDLAAAGHLTCVGAGRAEVDAVAAAYAAAGVHRIVALRGDPPEGSGRFTPHPEGYGNAADLVAGLRRIADFDISVAAYPEGHPDSPSPAADLDNLKRKLDAGARRAITQFFFEPETYFRFMERARSAGITAPIVPGILPVTNFKTVQEFARRCGARVPAWLAKTFEGLDNDPATRELIAATVAVDLCLKLKAQGVTEFHIYTLNRAELTLAICHMLGVRPAAQRRRHRGACEDAAERRIY